MDSSGFESTDELAVHWSTDIPVGNLRRFVQGILPPGDWVAGEQMLKAIKETSRQLMALRCRAMAGRPIVLIRRDFSEIALGELPARQATLLDADSPREADAATISENALSADERSSPTEADHSVKGGHVSHPSLEESASAFSNPAIGVAMDLIAKHERSGAISAEECLIALAGSPDSALTSRVLKMAGSGDRVFASDAMILKMSALQVFPKLLLTDSTYMVRFEKFFELTDTHAVATFKRANSGKIEPSAIDTLFLASNHIEIVHSGCKSNLLFRLGAAAGLQFDVEVTLTVSPFTQTIKSANAIRLADEQMIVQGLQRLMSQLDLPL